MPSPNHGHRFGSFTTSTLKVMSWCVRAGGRKGAPGGPPWTPWAGCAAAGGRCYMEGQEQGGRDTTRTGKCMQTGSATGGGTGHPGTCKRGPRGPRAPTSTAAWKERAAGRGQRGRRWPRADTHVDTSRQVHKLQRQGPFGEGAPAAAAQLLWPREGSANLSSALLVTGQGAPEVCDDLQMVQPRRCQSARQ